MAEEISLLMDGELDPQRVDNACRLLRSDEMMASWVCYHVIGDVLRDTGTLSPAFSGRFAARLAAEPTVLAPSRRAVPAGTRTTLALAASAAAVAVVGWAAFKVYEPEAAAERIAAAPAVQSQRVDAPVVRRPVDLGDYLIVHQEFSPTTMIQGVQPYIRAVASDDSANR